MRVAVAVLGLEVTRTSNSAEELCRSTHGEEVWDEREYSQIAFVIFEIEARLCPFFSLCGTSQHRAGDGGEGRSGRSPIPFFFFSSRHPPKLLILQRAGARANADRTFSDQQLGRVTGKEENKNVGLGEHRMLATVILVFLLCVHPCFGLRSYGALFVLKLYLSSRQDIYNRYSYRTIWFMVCGILGLNLPNKRYSMAKAVKVDGVLQLADAQCCLIHLLCDLEWLVRLFE